MHGTQNGSEERERRRQPMWRQWPQGRQCNAKQTSLTSESAAEAHHCTSLLLHSSSPLAFPLYPAEIYVLWHHIILLTWIPTPACLASCSDCFNTFSFISNRCKHTHVSFQLCYWIPVPFFLCLRTLCPNAPYNCTLTSNIFWLSGIVSHCRAVMWAVWTDTYLVILHLA